MQPHNFRRRTKSDWENRYICWPKNDSIGNRIFISCNRNLHLNLFGQPSAQCNHKLNLLQGCVQLRRASQERVWQKKSYCHHLSPLPPTTYNLKALPFDATLMYRTCISSGKVRTAAQQKKKNSESHRSSVYRNLCSPIKINCLQFTNASSTIFCQRLITVRILCIIHCTRWIFLNIHLFWIGPSAWAKVKSKQHQK